jgi:hypothetical protein
VIRDAYPQVAGASAGPAGVRRGGADACHETWVSSVVVKPLLTVGHGTAGEPELVRLLEGAGVTRVVDVRRYPGSRAHPRFRREKLANWLPADGIDYRWEERLGGRRQLPAESPDLWWHVAAFRAYADHMRSVDFLDAISGLLTESATATTTVMCSETLWWRCHRRLIADFAVLARGIDVCHIQHDGRIIDHVVSAGARLSPEGLLVYDAPERSAPPRAGSSTRAAGGPSRSLCG